MTAELLARAEALAWASDLRQRGEIIVRAARRSHMSRMGAGLRRFWTREVHAAGQRARRQREAESVHAPDWVPAILANEYADRARMWGRRAASAWARREMREMELTA